MKAVRILASRFHESAKEHFKFATQLQNRLRTVGVSAKEKSTSSSGDGSKGGSDCKPYSSLPGPRGYPYFGTLPEVSKMMEKLHIFKNERCKQYGPIWKEPLPQGDIVVIASIKGAHDIENFEGQNQKRAYPPALAEYYRASGRSPGISQKCGEMWRKDRRALEKLLLNPSEVSKDLPKMHAVAKDFIARLDKIKCSEGNIKNIDSELFKYVLESCCVLLFNRRHGNLQDNPPASAATLMDSVRGSCKTSGPVLLHSPFITKMFYSKQWSECTECLDRIYKIGVNNVDKLLLTQKAGSDSIIGRIHAMDVLSKEELYSCANDLLINMITTTPSFLQFAFYELAKRSDVQQKALGELTHEIPPGKEISCEGLQKLHYMKAFIREVLRLYPVEHTGVTRVLERDEIIGGYKVPKGKNVMLDPYLIGRSPDLYDEPNAFIPERWLKDGRLCRDMEPLAWIPFGVGERSCVGKRIAVVASELCILEMLRNFRMSTKTKELMITSRACLEPTKPIHLNLSKRLL